MPNFLKNFQNFEASLFKEIRQVKVGKRVKIWLDDVKYAEKNTDEIF